VIIASCSNVFVESSAKLDELNQISRLKTLIAQAKAQAENEKAADLEKTSLISMSSAASTSDSEVSTELQDMKAMIQAQTHMKQTMLSIARQKKLLADLKDQDEKLRKRYDIAEKEMKASEEQLKRDSEAMLETASSFNHKIEPKKVEKKPALVTTKAEAKTNTKEISRVQDKVRLASQQMEIETLKKALLEVQKKQKAVPEVKPAEKVSPEPAVDPVAEREELQKRVLQALHTELTSL
jgi:hypothetical protein